MRKGTGWFFRTEGERETLLFLVFSLRRPRPNWFEGNKGDRLVLSQVVLRFSLRQLEHSFSGFCEPYRTNPIWP